MNRRVFIQTTATAALTAHHLLSSAPPPVVTAPVRDVGQPVFRRGQPMRLWVSMKRNEKGYLRIYASDLSPGSKLREVQGAHKLTMSQLPYNIIKVGGQLQTNYTGYTPLPHIGFTLWIKDLRGGWWLLSGEGQAKHLSLPGTVGRNGRMFLFTPTDCVHSMTVGDLYGQKTA